MPAESGPARYGEPQPPIDRTDRATQIFGIVLLGLGVSVMWGDWWSPLRGWLFPLGLMALGAWLLFRPDRTDEPSFPPPVPPTTARAAAPSTSAWSWPHGRRTGGPARRRPAGRHGIRGSVRRLRGARRHRGSKAPARGDPDHCSAHHRPARAATRAALGPPPAAPWDVPPSPVPDDGSARRPRPRSSRSSPPPSPPPPRRPRRVRRAAHLDRRGVAHRGRADDRLGRRPRDPRPGVRPRILRRRLTRAHLPGVGGGRGAR